MIGLTEKQKKILDFLKKFTAENGYPPTVKEIMHRFDFASPTAATTHLIALEKKGYVKKMEKRARGNVPVNFFKNKNEEIISVPLINNEANAGLLSDSSSDTAIEETFDLPKSIAQGEGNFLIKVIGDSMIDAHIKEGDMVLIDPSNKEPYNGDIVAAKIDENGSEKITIKRFFKENDFIKLESENKNYSPIIKESAEIVGKVIGLIRLKI